MLYIFVSSKHTNMSLFHLYLLFVNWTNGAIVMTVVFGLVIIALIGAVMMLAKTDRKKEKSL